MQTHCKSLIMPCAACKLLSRRCTENCVFLPYFHPSEPEKFAAVHRVFGASNVNKMLQEIAVDDRRDAVTSLVYEATARVKEPVYGSVAIISSLQKQVLRLQSALDEVVAETVVLRTQLSTALSMMVPPPSPPPVIYTLEMSGDENNHEIQTGRLGYSYASEVTEIYALQDTDPCAGRNANMY